METRIEKNYDRKGCKSIESAHTVESYGALVAVKSKHGINGVKQRVGETNGRVANNTEEAFAKEDRNEDEKE